MNQAASNPSQTIFDAKRLIGRRFADREVQGELPHWPFRVSPGEGDKPFIEVEFRGETRAFSPEVSPRSDGGGGTEPEPPNGGGGDPNRVDGAVCRRRSPQWCWPR